MITFTIFGLLTGCSTEKSEQRVSAKTKATEVNKVKINEYLLPEHHSKVRTKPITHVVIHFMSNVSAKPNNPYEFNDIYRIFKDYELSTHYVIDREGEVYRLVPEERVAFHAGKGKITGLPNYKNKLNEYSIGIELLAIGTKEEMEFIIPEAAYETIDPMLIGYTDLQYKSLNVLLNRIYETYPAVKQDREHVIGHDEYAPGRKSDPGSLFEWSKLGY